jgi:hypothetical protein
MCYYSIFHTFFNILGQHKKALEYCYIMLMLLFILLQYIVYIIL